MELELIRIALSLQAFVGGDAQALDRLESDYHSGSPVAVVEPAETPLWSRQGEVVYGDLSTWLAALGIDDPSDIYIAINRSPLFLSHEELQEYIAEPAGFGPEYHDIALCITSTAGTQAYWLNSFQNYGKTHLTLWRLNDDKASCDRETASLEQARSQLIAAQERMITYTETVFGPDGFWVSDVFRPNLELIQSDGAGGHAFASVLEPGQRRALIEARAGLKNAGVFGGMGTWTDHYPPEELEGEYQEVLESWSAAADLATIAVVNGPPDGP